MPTHSCSGKDKADSKALGAAILQILQRVHIDDEHDIPYLAGYSKDGKTIYIDRHLPKRYDDKYLVLHEMVEKSLIDELGLPYEFAHAVATAAERELVMLNGHNWVQYDTFMQKYIKTAEHEQLINLPQDLDLTPYGGKLFDNMINRMK